MQQRKVLLDKIMSDIGEMPENTDKTQKYLFVLRAISAISSQDKEDIQHAVTCLCYVLTHLPSVGNEVTFMYATPDREVEQTGTALTSYASDKGLMVAIPLPDNTEGALKIAVPVSRIKAIRMKKEFVKRGSGYALQRSN